MRKHEESLTSLQVKRLILEQEVARRRGDQLTAKQKEIEIALVYARKDLDEAKRGIIE